MADLIRIDSNVPLALESGWEIKDSFKAKNTKVEFKGRTYLVQDKHILKYSGFEKFCRGLLGALACLFSLGFASIAKPVRRLFSKDVKMSKVVAYNEHAIELHAKLDEKRAALEGCNGTPNSQNARRRLRTQIQELEQEIADIPNDQPKA